jgi:hypothetical protein
MQPNVVVLVLSDEEVPNEENLPASLLELKKYGLQIILMPDNLRPHKKYIYAMQEYPDSIIITVDDDVMYDRSFIKCMYKSYLRFPRAVSAKRVHKITADGTGNLIPYQNWHYEYQDETDPSFDLLATGVGGVLYPPRLLPPETFDIEKIRELCLNADDIWLKFMEIKNNVPVVWVKTRRVHPVTIKNSQKVTLQKSNFHADQNDAYIDNLKNHYGIDLARCAKDSAQANI